MRYLAVALALFLLAAFCGWMQTDYVHDVWDLGFALCFAVALSLCAFGADDILYD